MSSSMWAWRVFVPGLGLAASLLVFYDSTRARSPVVRPGQGSAGRTAADRVVAEGRIVARPGAEVSVGTEAGGAVVAVAVAEKARVKKGDLLVELASDDQRSALVEAEARVAEVDAELAFLVREYQSRVKSPADAERFRAEIEGGRRDQEVAVARRRAALSAVDRCRLAVARARLVAPIDGVVLACSARAGEVAAAGSGLVTVCDLDRVRVVAEVDEFDAARIAPGDPVAISAEGHQGTSWAGTVEEVPDRVAERSVRPEDPGRPTDTRVLLVKIAPARPIPLKLGQRVEVEIRPRR